MCASGTPCCSKRPVRSFPEVCQRGRFASGLQARRALSPARGLPRLRRSGGAGRGRRARMRCTGAECPAQLVRNLVHFASRDCHGYRRAWPCCGTRRWWTNDLIRTPGDLYHLNAQDVAKLDRMGKKSAENLIAAIEKLQAAGSVPPHQRLRHPSGGYPWRPGAGGAVPHSGCAHGSGRGDADRGARRGSCHRPLFGGVVPESPVPALGGDASGGGREYGVQAGAAGRSLSMA